jgi:hypothetical protein
MAKWIGVDLDGTLAMRKDGDPLTIIGKPLEPMVARVIGWLAQGLEVRILTARVASIHTPKEIAKQRKLISSWCLQNIGRVLPITAEKDHEMEVLWDDRAIQVK